MTWQRYLSCQCRRLQKYPTRHWQLGFPEATVNACADSGLWYEVGSEKILATVLRKKYSHGNGQLRNAGIIYP